MTSLDSRHDSRFDEAEADVDRGEAWMYREDGAVNPLTYLATDWSSGVTKLGEAEFLNGIDKNGKKWSVLVGNTILKKTLIDGVFEEWSDEAGRFVTVATLGRVAPGEVVSIKFLGDREGAKYTYPDFRVSRKPAPKVDRGSQLGPDDDLPDGY